MNASKKQLLELNAHARVKLYSIWRAHTTITMHVSNMYTEIHLHTCEGFLLQTHPVLTRLVAEHEFWL